MGGGVGVCVGGLGEVALAGGLADAVVVGAQGVVVELGEGVAGGAVAREVGVRALDGRDGDTQEPESADQTDDCVEEQAVSIWLLLDGASHSADPAEQQEDHQDDGRHENSRGVVVD